MHVRHVLDKEKPDFIINKEEYYDNEDDNMI
jgi:hypothetical protein